MAKKTSTIASVELTARNKESVLKVTYKSGAVRYYAAHIPPESVIEFLGGPGWNNKVEAMRRDGIVITKHNPTPTPAPELKKIQDSMTESFYEFCTGEPAPENWKEIVAEEKGEQVSSQVSQASPELLPVPSQITPPAPTKSGPSAAEAVGFGICMALAYTAWIAREAAELLILALQALYITLSPIVCEASEKLWKAWLRIYPTIVPTACKTARIAAKQITVVVWWLWVVIA